MALKNRTTIKLNKKHEGKEFRNEFRFVGLVKPVRKKEVDGDNWFDVPFYQNTKTQTKKDRRVLQFNVETAYRNELKVELAGMEKDVAYIYSSKHKKSAPVDWNDRENKAAYPDETYHYIQQEWDKTEAISKYLVEGMWVDVRGHYEFDKFENDEGQEFKSVKRIIDNVYPLKNGEVEIKGLKKDDAFRVYDSESEGIQLGFGKANDEGVAAIKVGWLNPEGGELFVCKLDGETEGKRTKLEYTEDGVETDRITVRNNVTNDIQLIALDGKKEYVPYVRNFKSPDFFEVNSFEMQIGIKSTYQDEQTKDTKVNAVYLAYGKEKSVPKDVELTVYHKEAEEGKTPFADAFARLNRLDFLVVEGIDNNRAEFAMVEVEESEDDNPFEDVGEKVASYEQVSTGTKKGLEILTYVGGTYKKELLTDEEITEEQQNEDPFSSVNISDDDLPF
ncbi:hypothetical protein AF332_11875 [Sporosarcina globispora]|uniref:Uncharacterized protein n=1 Tax=Sporosarcina globispora TaxID=1459 RepID=A0A0M0GD71_SPOGL|nr:hypothetical protein [Sporosarcina globispora]KON87457.1 hypothetical protein AF332_11875 [Sporosarcina globispora]